MQRICIVLHFLILPFFDNLPALLPAGNANISKHVAYSLRDPDHDPPLFWRGKCSLPLHQEAANSSNKTFTLCCVTSRNVVPNGGAAPCIAFPEIAHHIRSL
jgi:hypothetical protein